MTSLKCEDSKLLINKRFDWAFVAEYENTSKGLSKGAIAGIVIGAAAFTMLVTGLILFLFYRRRKLPPALLAQIERCKFSIMRPSKPDFQRGCTP